MESIIAREGDAVEVEDESSERVAGQRELSFQEPTLGAAMSHWTGLKNTPTPARVSIHTLLLTVHQMCD